MFSEALERALCAALQAHEGQFRKGGEVPYIVHPLHVAFLLARCGADDEVIQAGVLHDVVEDCDDWTLERLRLEFGRRVERIVAELTEDKSRPWEERKQSAIDHVPDMSRDAIFVKACDKLHNLEGLLAQLERATNHDVVWKSFRGGRDATLRMDRKLVDALAPHLEVPLAEALRRAQVAVERLGSG